jgi:hypothetical protein
VWTCLNYVSAERLFQIFTLVVNVNKISQADLDHATTYSNLIQGVSEIGALILTGNRTRQKEQLFYLPYCRKTMFNSKKNWRDFSLK